MTHDMAHGTRDGVPVDHDTHAPLPILAREYVGGWYAGHSMRHGDSAPATAWITGYTHGIEDRGER